MRSILHPVSGRLIGVIVRFLWWQMAGSGFWNGFVNDGNKGVALHRSPNPFSRGAKQPTYLYSERKGDSKILLTSGLKYENEVMHGEEIHMIGLLDDNHTDEHQAFSIGYASFSQ